MRSEQTLVRSILQPFSVRILQLSLTGFLAAVSLPGCAGKARMADDPFRRPGYGSGSRGSSGGSSDDPRYRTGAAIQETFEKANQSARGKDVSSDVSTDPLSDRLQAARQQAEGQLHSASDSVSEMARNKLDPLMDSANQQVGRAKDRIEGLTKNLGEGSETFELYERVRKQLEVSGAKNWKFDKDEATGESIFRVELPHRNNPTLFRVFEAKSPDELKAMLAVAEQVDRWVASGATK
jgi:hypothetical protein